MLLYDTQNIFSIIPGKLSQFSTSANSTNWLFDWTVATEKGETIAVCGRRKRI